ncbi:MAG: phosphoribosylformimino-5-aminoimidazole carboxamide ribotide isomerase [Lachnospiraceae bacterium]|nr:phosphoribosylformimino-5-aminoimidazole carboxamide ribotide isomerase [Lachnospiraceae bacterium]
MRFRPCIDIHNGKVKQIVGSSLTDQNNQARENFVSERDSGFYADFYRKDGLVGGHIILLNPKTSPYYEATREQALLALRTDPGHLQIGGGIRPENAAEFLQAGASHVIVTSYVFQNGQINYENLERMKAETGREHLVLDLSCRKKEENYYIMTDRWQKFTQSVLNRKVLEELASYCDEFLVHAVDAEGKAAGIEKELALLLGGWDGCPITYAGGVGSFSDLEELYRLGRGRLDVTIGSALDLFGGNMPYRKVLEFCERVL